MGVWSVPISPARAVAPCAGRYSTEAPAIGTTVAAAPATPPETAKSRPAAKLELKPEGRFSYTFTRGDQQETAEGRWRAGEDRVVLTGDPITAPAFVLGTNEALSEPVLRIELDLPNGLSRQYFTVAVRLADGTIVGRGFTDAPFELPTGTRNPPVALRIDVPTLTLSSAEFTLGPGAGHRLHVRFAANDLGKVAFADTPLIERDGALVLPHAGGDLSLRREGRCSAE
jgi:hypothetical protein